MYEMTLANVMLWAVLEDRLLNGNSWWQLDPIQLARQERKWNMLSHLTLPLAMDSFDLSTVNSTRTKFIEYVIQCCGAFLGGWGVGGRNFNAF